MSGRDLILCCQKDLPGASRRDLAPWFVVVGYNFFILVAAPAIFSGHAIKEYAEPNGMPICG